MNVNVDPLNAPNWPSDGDRLRYGIRGVRLVSREGVDDHAAYLQSAGVMVLAAITEQSGGHVCPCDVAQIGNEPDVAGTADSMNALDYVRYWNLYYDTWFAPGKPFDGTPVISAGLGSGQPSYWQAIKNAGGLKGCAGLALHPYAKTAISAMSLILNYRAITPGMPVYVTEWTRPTGETTEFAAMLDRLSGVVWHARFSFGGQSDNQFNATPQQLRLIGAA